jgi:hypothetical protein
VRVLLGAPPGHPEEVAAIAGEAAWPLPRTIAAVAIAGARREAAIWRLPPDAIAETIGEVGCAIVPDPDGPGRLGLLRRAIAEAGAPAGLGTTVGWQEAAVSFARARAALELSDGAPALILAREHAGELLLHAEPRLADELAEQRLAPLAGLPAGALARLTETLRVWLAEQGRLGPVAARLGIHPQTARYRLGRLRDLFGEALDDPDQRFWLELALRARPAG